jgi:hypothetical protein
MGKPVRHLQSHLETPTPDEPPMTITFSFVFQHRGVDIWVSMLSHPVPVFKENEALSQIWWGQNGGSAVLLITGNGCMRAISDFVPTSLGHQKITTTCPLMMIPLFLNSDPAEDDPLHRGKWAGAVKDDTCQGLRQSSFRC